MSSADLKWQEKSRTEVFHTPVFTVTERKSQGPDGQEGIYIVNEAPDWVIVIPELENCFLMVEQWRHGEKALSIEFPGGVIEKGEEPEAGARRELKEETGAEAGELIFLGKFNPNPALFNNHVFVFCAKQLQFKSNLSLDSDEFVEPLKLKKETVFEKMGSGEFFHALMGSAIALYRQKIAN